MSEKPTRATRATRSNNKPKPTAPEKPQSKEASPVKLKAIHRKLCNGTTGVTYYTDSVTAPPYPLGLWEEAQLKAGLLEIVE